MEMFSIKTQTDSPPRSRWSSFVPQKKGLRSKKKRDSSLKTRSSIVYIPNLPNPIRFEDRFRLFTELRQFDEDCCASYLQVCFRIWRSRFTQKETATETETEIDAGPSLEIRSASPTDSAPPAKNRSQIREMVAVLRRARAAVSQDEI
jgi:hypothetical protein